MVKSLSAPFAVTADALSFVVSALLLRKIDADEPPPCERDKEP